MFDLLFGETTVANAVRENASAVPIGGKKGRIRMQSLARLDLK